MTSSNSFEEFYFDRAQQRRAMETDRHYHTTYEVYYLLSGECRYFIDDFTYDLGVGDVIILPPGVIHRTIYSCKPHSRLLINFSFDYMPSSALALKNNLAYLYRGKELSERVLDLFLQIEKEYTSPDLHSDDLIRCYTAELVLMLLRSNATPVCREEMNPIVDKTIRYIREHYTQQMSLTEAARYSAVSPEHLSRLFKRVTGFGFSEYLTVYRLQRAEEMLINEPGRSVSEVAFACGFNDSNYFSHRFKETYGYPPSHVRHKQG
jgi:AraC-like DNA-binding protein